MISFLLSPLLLTAIAASTPLPCTLACTCLPPARSLAEAVQAAARNSEAVFSGRVLRIETPTLAEVSRGEWGSWDEIRAYILVTERWKGEPGDTAVVLTSAQSSMCGADLRRGERYVVYAERSRTGVHSAPPSSSRRGPSEIR